MFNKINVVLRYQPSQWGHTLDSPLNFSVRLECTFSVCSSVLLKNGGSGTLFTGPASTFSSKNNFKTGSHGTIHTFKNYFATVFLVFSF